MISQTTAATAVAAPGAVNRLGGTVTAEQGMGIPGGSDCACHQLNRQSELSNDDTIAIIDNHKLYSLWLIQTSRSHTTPTAGLSQQQ